MSPGAGQGNDGGTSSKVKSVHVLVTSGLSWIGSVRVQTTMQIYYKEHTLKRKFHTVYRNQVQVFKDFGNPTTVLR